MDKIDIFFKNCYGIKLLETSFDFTKNKSFIIYASNGSMKTSFAKTFKDFAEGKDSCDNIYPAKKADRKILKQNQKEVDKREIFVINSYDQTYRPSKIETLLINEQIKNEYDKIFNEIDEQKKIIIEKLKEQSGIKENPDRVMSFDIIFKNDNKAFFETLKSIEDGLKNFKAKFLASLIYVRIFNEKTKKLFEDSNFQERLQKYLNTYNKLIDESTFFKKGIFDHKNASDVVKNLKENGFFRADHKVFLNGKIEIKTEEELEKMIEAEKNKILENKELKKNFNDIERTLSTNKELRDFLHYIKANQIILENLNNVSLFKRNLWIAYLFEQKEIYKSLMNIYQYNSEKLENIRTKISEEKTQWQDVLNKFNKRFYVPFNVDIENKEDVILEEETPNLRFVYGDQLINERALVENVLSQGEKRALYLLNIIFEVEIRKKLKQKTLFIIDDIADSFDYQNKYAIIEYLRDIIAEDIFFQIILTHNYDFYRTVSERLLKKGKYHRDCKLYALKLQDKIELKKEKYQNNPFEHWKKNLDKPAMLISLIPFARNLIEYCKGTSDTEYLKLTSLLHVMKETETLKIKDLTLCINSIILDIEQNQIGQNELEKIVLDVIYDTAKDIAKSNEESLELENKIVLSIAIRLKTEFFLIKKINEINKIEGTDSVIKEVKTNQTIKLIEQYKNMFPNEIEYHELLNKVILMTPENIHLNSFMYEPIIDMSSKKFKDIYNAIINKLI